MSKTLSIKKSSDAVALMGAAVHGEPLTRTLDPLASNERQVKPFTAAELRAMLAALEPSATDETMDLPTGAIPGHLIADKSQLPPVGERSSGPIQPPPKIHGSFSLNGIPLLASPIGPLPANINPSTGQILAQVMPPRQGGCISPPPSRNFR